MAHDVFISYSSEDKTVADAVCATLENRKIRCWIAPRDVPPGEPFAASLIDAVKSARVMVLVLSEGSNQSQYVLRELNEAVDNGIPIIPFRIEDVEPSGELRFYIKSLHWLDALDPPLELHLKRLTDSVNALLSVGEHEQPPMTVTAIETPSEIRRAIPVWAIALIGIAVVVILGTVGWWVFPRLNSSPPSPTTIVESVIDIPTDTLDLKPSPSPESTPMVMSPTTPADQFRVGFVTDTGGIDDKSFNSTTWYGILRAQEVLGIEAQFLQSEDATQYAPNLTDFAGQGYDLVIAAGFAFGGTLANIAANFPEVDFAIIDFTYPAQFWVSEGVIGYDECIPNVQGQNFKTDQAAYLAGYLAAGMSKTGKIGVFGGAQIPPVTIFNTGFQTGMEHYNDIHGTDVVLIGWDNETGVGLFTDDFSDLEKGREAAEALFNQGVDIFMPVAGFVGSPGFDIARQRGGYGIWIDFDGYNIIPEARDVMLTSVVKNIDNSVYDVIKAAKSGNFQGCGAYIGDLANSGVGIAPYHDLSNIIPDSLKDEIEELKAQIISGEIKDTGCTSYPIYCPIGLY